MLTFEKLTPANGWLFCLENDSNFLSIQSTYCFTSKMLCEIATRSLFPPLDQQGFSPDTYNNWRLK